MGRFPPAITALLVCFLLLAAASGSPGRSRDEADAYDLFETDYRWLEIEDIGEPVTELEDNGVAGPFDIGFDFPYFGRLYDRFYICANGMVGFGPADEYEQSANSELPDRNLPNNIVALYWKNLDPHPFWGVGAVFYGHRDGNLVVQFQRYPEVAAEGRFPDNTITMQAVFAPDGDIILQYAAIGEAFDLGVGTVGVENEDGSEGITVRHNGQGERVAAGTAFLLSEHGPGSFLVWDGGLNTPSGEAEAEALRTAGHSVTLFKRRLNQALPNDINAYEAVFINLGNFGVDGRDYHQLTQAEGQVLADYAQAGGAIYLEGGDFWTADPATPVHQFFMIEGVVDGRAAQPPIAGVAGGIAGGLSFDAYEAADNDYVDHIRAVGNAEDVLTFQDRDETAVGMVAFHAQDYRAIGGSLEFGALVDGEGGSKAELMRRMVEFFRSPPPEFPSPVNLRATAGDGEVTLTWEMPPRRGAVRQERIELQHRLAALRPRGNAKPGPEARAEMAVIKRRLAELDADIQPRRDDLQGFNIYLDGERYDFTNARNYTAIELENGRAYSFTVTALYRDPDGESDPTGAVVVVPTASWEPPREFDFEEFNGALTPFPGEGGWEWGRPAVGAASGERAWGTLLSQPYPDLADFVLTTPTINLPAERRVWLTFNHFYDCEAGWDGGRLEYSPDGGERWALLTPVGGYPEASVFALDEGAGYSGASGGWRPVTFDLTALAGSSIIVHFLFKSDDSNFRAYAGWFIDDLRLILPQTGSITITVRDQGDGMALPGATVRLGDQFSGVTDDQGQVLFAAIPAANYHARAERIGYSPTEADFELQPDQNLVRDMFLTVHDSRLIVDPNEFVEELDAGARVVREARLSNDGEQPTEFQVYLNLFPIEGRGVGSPSPEQPTLGPRRDQPWQLIRSYDITRATGDQFVICADFVRNGAPTDYYFIAGAGDFGSGDCRFYQFTREGGIIGSVEQGSWDIAGWGVRDLANDGTFLYGGVGNRLYRFDPLSGSALRTEFQSPLEVNRAVAYVPGEDAFWVGDRDDSWLNISREGEILDRVPDHGLTGVVGMAWNPSDPDGAFLYIHNQESPDGGAALYRFNPRTRELIRQLETAGRDEGFAGGAFTTYLYDTQTWMLGVVIQGREGDFLKLYELWPHQNWVSVTPIRGALEAGAGLNLEVTFDAGGLVDSEHQAIIEVHDLRRGTVLEAPCTLAVIGGAGGVEGEVSLDGEGNVVQVTVTLNGAPTHPEADGFYQFVGLIPGRFQLRAGLEGYTPFVGDSFDVPPNQQVIRDIRLTHLQRGAINGRVRSVYAEDAWLPGVEVAATSADDPYLFIVDTTDADGSYYLSVPAGIYTVTPRCFGWRGPAADEVHVGDNDEVIRDFVLDDHLPVRSLRTNGYYDDRVALDWAPPGTVGVTTSFQYDNGVLANAVYLRGRDDILAARFEPEGLYDIDSLQIYMFRRNDIGIGGGWPDWPYDPIYMVIFAEDPQSGLPGELLWEQFVDAHLRRPGWVTVRTRGLRFLSGAFYVGWHQDTDPNRFTYDAAGLDNHFDNPGTVFLRIDGGWSRFDGLPGDNILRATVWGYAEDEQRDMAPRARQARAIREVGLGEAPNGLTLLSVQPQAPQFLAELFALPLPGDAGQPRRDPPNGYNVIVDGQVAAEGVDSTHWEHVVGSDGENQPHNYSVTAVYADGQELEGAAVVDSFNMAPASPTSVRVVNDGLRWTVVWSPPTINEDGTRCVDYAGCHLILNGDTLATVNAADTSFTGEIANGREAWYELQLVGFDEVPNNARPVIQRVPLGVSQVFDFETNVAFFTAAPAGMWLRSRTLANGPGSAHSGSYAWGTRPVQGQYENNADWTVTTVAEYFVASPNARLEFFHFVSAEAGNDGGQLLVSADGGAWTLLRPIGDYPDQTVAAFQNQPGWTGATGGWQMVSVELAAYQERAVKLRWRFASDASINWYPGWYLDDVVLWGAAPPLYAQVYGAVRDQAGQPVAGATVSAGRASGPTAQNGTFRLTGIVPGQTRVSAVKAGYVDGAVEVNIRARDSLRVDLELYRPNIALDQNRLQFALGGNDRLESGFVITNNSEIPVPYQLRLLALQPDRDRRARRPREVDGRVPGRDQPGDRQFDWNATQVTGQQRIMGVEYAQDQFILTSADPNRGLLVTVLNRDGGVVRQFNQPMGRRVGWGLRDLAWDGQFLYGSQNDSIYAFSLQGALGRVQLGAPLTVNRALAFDPEADGFWCAEWDSPWYLVNRDGEAQVSWAEHGLRGVYGLAYHPADPDGLPVYALNSEDNGASAIYRADPRRGQIERLYEIPGPPTGLCIIGHWDATRWIAAGILGAGPQRLIGLELGPRVSWVTASPIEGNLEAAGGRQNVTVQFVVPPGAERGQDYSADIVVRAFGGTQATLPIVLEIVEGFRHFGAPVESDDFMDVRVNAALVYGREPLVGSEIALMTPARRVGGAARWVSPPCDFRAYLGDQAFAVGDSLAFRIWDAGRNAEYSTEVEYLAGQPVFQINQQVEVRLTVRETDRQSVQLDQGWNLISSFVRPVDPAVPIMFDVVNRRGHLTLVKDGAGRFYAPRFGFNGLGPWNPLGGYLVNVSADDSLVVSGARVPSDSPIALSAGWNAIGYLLDHAVDPRVGFEGIMDALLIAKNGQGDFIAPRFDFFGLRELRPGEGYKVKVDRQIELVYNPGGRDDWGAATFLSPTFDEPLKSLSPPSLAGGINLKPPSLAGGIKGGYLSHSLNPSTGSDMSLLITFAPPEAIGEDVEVLVTVGAKWEIGKAGKWDSGRVVGRGRLDRRPAGVVIRGDDTLTTALDGAEVGERLRLVAVRDGKVVACLRERSEAISDAGLSQSKTALVYESDGFAALTLAPTVAAPPTNFVLDPVHPNPFNSRATVRFGLPVGGSVRGAIVDLQGREMWTFEQPELPAGWNEISVDASALPSGVYWLKLNTGGWVAAEKLVLVR